MSSRKKFLDQKLVTEFAEYRALKSKIEKWLKLCREEILEKFKAGYACPTGGPFLLEKGGGSRSAIDWKQEFFERMKNDFIEAGSEAVVAEQLTIEKMVEMERLSGRNPYDEIEVKPNPSYAGKLMKAIVKKLDARTARGF